VGKQTPQFELLLSNSEINIPQKQIENANRRRGESKNVPNSFGIPSDESCSSHRFIERRK
jgi:hypothetical protein